MPTAITGRQHPIANHFQNGRPIDRAKPPVINGIPKSVINPNESKSNSGILI